MRRSVTYLCASIALFALATVLRAGEEKVALDKLPRAVRDAVKARFPDGEMKKASTETEDGKTTFEVSVKNGEQNIDVELNAEGQIMSLEKAIAAKDLPKAVTEALEGKYPNSQFKLVEEIVKVKDKEEKLECYEILFTTADSKTIEAQVSAEGKILKEEVKKAKK